VTAAVEEIEIRCPATIPLPNGYCPPGKLLMKLLISGEIPSFVHPDNLVELPCEDCRGRLRKRGVNVKRVLHRFDLTGALIETLTDAGVI
jgi:hypothetical protein